MKYCMSVHIELGLLIRSDAELAGIFVNSQTGQPATGAEVRQILHELLRQGQQLIPVNPNCDNWSPTTGCGGHE